MKTKRLRMKFAVRAIALFMLLLGSTSMTKLQAQNIVFADVTVKDICVNNWDTNGDGELSYEEAAAVTDLGTVFQWNDDITSFDELQYFTGLSSIGRYAFNDCSNLISITIPNSVFVIRVRAFQNCTSLASIVFPNSLVSIDAYAFSNCSSLTSVFIPKEVSSLNYDSYHSSDPESWWGNPFDGCTSLEEIVVDSENPIFDSRNDCNAIIKGNTLITGCKNTIIPESVNEIGLEAFTSCSSLTSITIPNAVTTIGKYSFNGCTGLTSISIPASVTSIGNYAFRDCTSLETVTMLSTSVTTLYSGDAFSNTSEDLVIYVPYESIEDYKTTDNWNFYESKIKGWLQKSVTGYGTSTESDKWVFIASPLTENTAPTTINGMIVETATEYDLYRFNQAISSGQWENYKQEGNHYHFELENGRGYLYANKEDVNLIFKGDFNEGTSMEVELAYTEGMRLAGWNLVGNPFPVEATVTGRSYYVMNEAGTGIKPEAVSAGGTIAACTGIVVKVEATESNPMVTFSKISRQTTSNKGLLQIAVANANTRSNAVEDKAIVSFNEGDELGKFYFGEQNANIYIPQNGEEYAIATAEKTGEMPLNFKSTKNGEYTITVNQEGVEMEYLHLIDYMTGANVNLLQTPEYTFNAKTTDYESRFKLVFAFVSGDADGDNDTFAFISNGNIIVNGEGTVQVIDVTGRVIVCRDVACNVSTNGMTPGVYVLRLVNGNDVKTQKMVIE